MYTHSLLHRSEASYRDRLLQGDGCRNNWTSLFFLFFRWLAFQHACWRRPESFLFSSYSSRLFFVIPMTWDWRLINMQMGPCPYRLYNLLSTRSQIYEWSSPQTNLIENWLSLIIYFSPLNREKAWVADLCSTMIYLLHLFLSNRIGQRCTAFRLNIPHSLFSSFFSFWITKKNLDIFYPTGSVVEP